MTGRQCSDCQLCCRLVPVRELNKDGGQKCQHQRAGLGCNIYPRRPHSCRNWNCAWLIDPSAAGLRRPDRGGYVVDIMPEFVKAIDNATGEATTIPVIQVWIDPKRPLDWWKDQGLLAYLDERGKTGFAAIMRLSSSEGYVIFPPSMTGQGWQRGNSSTASEEHTFAEVAAALAHSGIEVVVEVDDKPRPDLVRLSMLKKKTPAPMGNGGSELLQRNGVDHTDAVPGVQGRIALG